MRGFRAWWRAATWPLAQRLGWQPLALEWNAAGAELVWGSGEVPEPVPFHEQVVATLRYRPFNRWFAQRTPLTPGFVAELEAELDHRFRLVSHDPIQHQLREAIRLHLRNRHGIVDDPEPTASA